MTYPTDIHTGVTVPEAMALEAYARGRHVLECGSWYGYSTIVMGNVAASLVAVDSHHGDRHAGHRDTEGDFRRNLARYGLADKVQVEVGRFQDVLPGFATGSFEMVFLDGMHDRASVARDLELIAPLVASGGSLLLHDYDVPDSWEFEVREVVDPWLAANPEWRLVAVVDKLAVVERR